MNTFVQDKHNFLLEALVVEHLDAVILAGTPFMECNDIAMHPAKHYVNLGNGTTYMYGSCNTAPDSRTIRCALVLHAPATVTTVCPGEFHEIKFPSDIPPDSEYDDDRCIKLSGHKVLCLTACGKW